LHDDPAATVAGPRRQDLGRYGSEGCASNARIYTSILQPQGVSCRGAAALLDIMKSIRKSSGNGWFVAVTVALVLVIGLRHAHAHTDGHAKAATQNSPEQDAAQKVAERSASTHTDTVGNEK
jgi:hypothetical protein